MSILGLILIIAAIVMYVVWAGIVDPCVRASFDRFTINSDIISGPNWEQSKPPHQVSWGEHYQQPPYEEDYHSPILQADFIQDSFMDDACNQKAKTITLKEWNGRARHSRNP